MFENGVRYLSKKILLNVFFDTSLMCSIKVSKNASEEKFIKSTQPHFQN